MSTRSRIKRKTRPYDMARMPKFKEFTSKTFLLHLIKKYRRQLFWLAGIVLAILILIPLFTYIYFAGDLKDKVSITSRSKTGLTLMDQDGKTFFTFYQPKAVTYIPLSQIPSSAQKAVVSSEDKNFYTNAGFSLTGMGRAFINNLLARKVIEGGSTISQELVKIALLNANRTVLRKYQELVLSLELNRRFSKQDILEMYLNSVYFGEGAFGIENAAQAYFGIPASKLSLGQSALLIGLLPAPSAYSPLSNDPEIALRRQKIVLKEMAEDNVITQAQTETAINTPIVYNPALKTETNTLAPHFALYVKDLLIKKYGEERIISEGFKVKTTLNSTWQEYAERAVKNRIVALQGNNAGNGAAVAIDPKTGNINVMVGSHDWTDETNGKINMTIRPRQPGSSFKPLIYAEALEQKQITPATILHDNPISYGNYKPLDYDKRFRGDVTARRALANSLNIPAVEVMNMVGVPSGLQISKKFGITTLGTDASKYGLSLVLGSGEVSLLEMTNSYAVFADEGVYHQPNAILEIKNKYDEMVDTEKKSFWYYLNPLNLFKLSGTNQTRQVISDDTAFLISSMLSDNAARAETFGGALTIGRSAAVKTGTTNDYRDALTIGYTPSLVVGVWVGNNDNSPMDNIAGSLGAAPIWRNMMTTFLLGKPLESFIKPASVVEIFLCPANSSEKISSTSAKKEFFIRGTQPQDCSEKLTPSPTPKPTATPEPSVTNAPTEVQSPTPEQQVSTISPTKTGINPTQFSFPSPTTLIPTIGIPL